MDKMYLSLRLSDSQSESVTQKVQLLRTGNFNYESEGDLEITPEILLSMKKNFDAKVRGYDDGKLPIDYFHEGDKIAAGWIQNVELTNENSELWAEVKWTPTAKKMISDGELRYLSAEFHFDYRPNEGKESFGPTLFGGGLTNRPFVKGMEPVAKFKEQDPISEKISKLIKEGYPQDQAVAIANNMASHGKLEEQGKENKQKELAQMPSSSYDKSNSKGENKMPDDANKPEGGDMSPEDMKKCMAVQSAELAELKKKLAEYEAKMSDSEKEKVMNEKKTSFDKMLSEGKTVEAQRESFMSGDMVKFAELAQPLNKKGSGQEGPGDDEAAKDPQATIVALAEVKAKELKLPLGRAISIVLDEKPELRKSYEAAVKL